MLQKIKVNRGQVTYLPKATEIVCMTMSLDSDLTEPRASLFLPRTALPRRSPNLASCKLADPVNLAPSKSKMPCPLVPDKLTHMMVPVANCRELNDTVL